MADDADPPRKVYGFKPKEFERVNEPATTSDVHQPAEIIGPNAKPPRADPGRIDVRELFQQAAAATPGPVLDPQRAAPAGATRNGENDVQAMLRENRARAEAAGLHQVAPPPPRRSRRKRDYWLLVLTCNGFFAFWAFGPWSNPVTFVYSLAGMGLTTAALTWVMWFVMDDY